MLIRHQQHWKKFPNDILMVLQSVSTKPVIISSWLFEPVAKEMSLFSYSDAAEAVLPYHVVMCTTFHYIAI